MWCWCWGSNLKAPGSQREPWREHEPGAAMDGEPPMAGTDAPPEACERSQRCAALEERCAALEEEREQMQEAFRVLTEEASQRTPRRAMAHLQLHCTSLSLFPVGYMLSISSFG